MSDPQTPPQPVRSLSSPPPIRRKSLMRQLTFQAAKYEPGDFIKPDPAFTRIEARKYIMGELKECLNKLSVVQDDHIEDDSYLNYCSNPRERLYHITQVLDELNVDESASEISFKVLEKYLNREPIDYDEFPVKLVQLVMGFIHTDLLPCGRTIYSYWNHTPFNALREATSLDQKQDEEKDQDQGQEQDQEEDEDYAITLRITYKSLFVTLASITLWIALTVSQLSPANCKNPIFRL